MECCYRVCRWMDGLVGTKNNACGMKTLETHPDTSGQRALMDGYSSVCTNELQQGTTRSVTDFLQQQQQQQQQQALVGGATFPQNWTIRDLATGTAHSLPRSQLSWKKKSHPRNTNPKRVS